MATTTNLDVLDQQRIEGTTDGESSQRCHHENDSAIPLSSLRVMKKLIKMLAFAVVVWSGSFGVNGQTKGKRNSTLTVSRTYAD